MLKLGHLLLLNLLVQAFKVEKTIQPGWVANVDCAHLGKWMERQSAFLGKSMVQMEYLHPVRCLRQPPDSAFAHVDALTFVLVFNDHHIW